jgi:cysteine-rich repeat protein
LGSACQKICSNGAINSPEACDDGNFVATDGCDAFCAIEPLYECPGTPGTTSHCNLLCGNGVYNTGGTAVETCDDGDAGGDGCKADCTVETLYNCTAVNGIPSVCTYTCGDGLLEAIFGEQCDDGGTSNSPVDGCDTTCQIVSGWECPTPGSLC